jgi:tRNA dimethylallyltransferase
VSPETSSTRAVPYLAIVGATGTGKSDLALDVAEALADRGVAAEVVGADAMQLYRGMDIGTAKVPVGERRGIPHRMLDVLDVTDEATVAWYQPIARAAVTMAQTGGAVPILVGGSGLYVSSVLHEFAFPGRDEQLRARLETEAATSGLAVLLSRLRELDPATAERVDAANPRRVIRALEIAELAQRGGAAGHRAVLPERPRAWRPVAIAGLAVARERLVTRLDARVERMWRAGLVAETEALLAAGLDRGTTASRAIGYAQASAQLRGELTREEAIAETQRLTRRYARRQVSWFTRYPELEWFATDEGTVRERERIVTALVDRVMR